MTIRSAQAVTGAGLAIGVLLCSPGVAQAGWAVAGSGTVPVKAGRMPVVSGVGTQVAGAAVTVDWSAATAATGYQVVRYNAGTSTTAVVGAGCAGVRTTTTCTETGVPDGAWEYAVRAVHGNWSGTLSGRAAATVATAATVTTTFPADRATYTAATWTGCATAGFCGTSTPAAGQTVTKVEYSIQAGTKFWNGNNFNSGSERWFTVSGNLASWSVPFAMANFPVGPNPYTLRVRVTDSSGQTATSTTTFTAGR
ncbi:hypothetical protein Q0Z83_082770 [Actinoplanes sichuanensis]|uniref:Fibronectin type-III domain-containing protein n=1 Tax=Actinoplanes sichuanensis TaxID=512349 RepID=A0ABW4AD00_9ACTN|nr:hypothetical protein [Actinoplanes sichuanensis]BEL10086.1 hypothetical protein Q0Z83_082770 [Actinoplanes sichuanensis]